VAINLLTNTLSATVDQPPTPAVRQAPTAVVNNNNNNNRQDYAAATQALDQLDALLTQLANQRDKFIYIFNLFRITVKVMHLPVVDINK